MAGFLSNLVNQALHTVSGGRMGADTDVFKGVSVRGGARNPVNNAWVGRTDTSQNRSGGGAPSGGGAAQVLSEATVAPVDYYYGGGGGSGGGGGGAAQLPALNQAAINNTQLSLDQLPALLQNALAAEAARRANALGAFDSQERTQRDQYNKSLTTNQQNYDSNFMAALRSGAGGLSGLLNILRGTGAAGGTAEDMARDTVSGVTSNDIRMGADTRDANQTALDSSLSSFLTDLRGKRQAAEDTFRNNEAAIRRDNLSQQQDLMQKMASFYSEGGRTAEATDWMNRSGSLTPQIAQNSRTQQSRYDTSPVQVKAPELTAFAAPEQPNVQVAAPEQLGSGIFTMNRRKEQQETTPTALPAGA